MRKKGDRGSLIQRIIEYIELDLFFMQVLFGKKFKEIEYCFNEHKKDCGGKVKFTLSQYATFWLQDKPGNLYKMVNRDGSFMECEVLYYPLRSTYENGKVKMFSDLRALMRMKKPLVSEGEEHMDIREVPVHFLELITKSNGNNKLL